MKRIITIAAGAALLGMVAAIPASAQTNINSTSTATSSVQVGHHISLQGTVAAISGNTLTILSEGKNWTINLADGFMIRSRNVLKVALSRMKVGDTVVIKGTVATSTASGQNAIDAKAVKDLSLNLKQASLRGVVSNLNTTLRSFTLTLQNGKVVNVSLDSNAKISLNGANSTSSIAGIQNGMTVGVKGVLDRNANLLNAAAVRGANSSVSAPVKDKENDNDRDDQHEISVHANESLNQDIRATVKSILH